MLRAYAVLVIPDNKQAIVSEHPKFADWEFDLRLQNGPSYFIRDEIHTAFDCKYMISESFELIYIFKNNDPTALFREIEWKNRSEKSLT